MKHTRRIATLLLALVMILSLATTALAEGESTTAAGSIKILSSVKDKTYDLYRIFDLTYTGTGESQKVSYTINSAWSDFFGEDGDGAEYITDTNTDEGLNAITVAGEQKYINITDANVAEFSKAALVYAVTMEPVKEVTGTGNDVTVGNLALGYYLVYPQGATEVTSGNSSICSLTSTVPSVEVSIKATYPTIQKEANINVGDVGEVIRYTITGAVPDVTGYNQYIYHVHDTMTKGLTFNEDVVVYLGDEDTAMPLSRYYCETPLTDEDGNTSFCVSIDVKGLVQNNIANVGDAIYVKYSATVNENAVAVTSKNSAILEYSNDPRDAESTDTTTPAEEIFESFKIVIDKYENGAESKKLPGAKFVLRNEADKYYFWNDEENKVQWIIIENPGELAQAVENETITVVTTNNNGAAEFNGIHQGAFYLVEVEAPAGYNLLNEAQEVILSRNKQNQGDEATLTVTAKVANSSGSTLPSTGGMGTTLFYTLGGILVLAAIVLLVTKKRMGHAA